MKRVTIAGAGLHGDTISSYLVANDCYEVVGFTDADPAKTGTKVNGKPVLGTDEKLKELWNRNETDCVALGIGDQKSARIEPRLELYNTFEDEGYELLTYVHSESFVDSSSSIGEGTIIYPGSVVAPQCNIGVASMLYSGVVVEHHASLGTNVYLGPGATLSGDVTLGESVFVGSNATIFPGVTLGDRCTVGAGCVVQSDHPPETTIT